MFMDNIQSKQDTVHGIINSIIFTNLDADKLCVSIKMFSYILPHPVFYFTLYIFYRPSKNSSEIT